MPELTPSEIKYLKDLAMLDYLRCDVEIKALRYDDRYNEAQKDTIEKYLEVRKQMSNVIDKINFNKSKDESTSGISLHGG